MRRADHDVRKTVAVHIAATAHEVAGIGAVGDSGDPKTVRAIERRGVEARGEGRVFSEDDVGRAVRGCADFCAVRAGDEVVETVAIHIARGAHRVAEIRERRRAIEAEAVRAIERGEIDVRG